MPCKYRIKQWAIIIIGDMSCNLFIHRKTVYFNSFSELSVECLLIWLSVPLHTWLAENERPKKFVYERRTKKKFFQTGRVYVL
jgi:hypothetical protein